ncbi:MAG: hypothetical protein PUC12_11670 [Clostridiales bacterium]|nr:hypothetical protein [Clostridiales bacterium]
MIKKLNKMLSIILVATILCNVFGTNVNAETILGENEKTVYIDGVEFNVSINDDFQIEVEGHTDISDAFLLVDENGFGELEIRNDEDVVDSEEYELEMDEFTSDDVDIAVYEEGDKVEDISSVDEIIEDTYVGQVAISAGGVVISLGMVLEALLEALLAVVIAGVLYIVVTEFYSKVEAASATKRKKVKKYYYKAAVWNGQVVVSPKGISKSKAIGRVKSNLSVYSFSSVMASAVIAQAGFLCSLPEIDAKRYKGHVYLWHYHKANTRGHVLHTGGFHSFYGAPIVGTI